MALSLRFEYRGVADLQGWDAPADWLGVFPQDTLLIQEAAVLAVPGGLEEAVVQDVFQGLVECAQDPLLGHPHRGIRVETHAFLVGDGEDVIEDGWYSFRNTKAVMKRMKNNSSENHKLITLCRESRKIYRRI